MKFLPGLTRSDEVSLQGVEREGGGRDGERERKGWREREGGSG